MIHFKQPHVKIEFSSQKLIEVQSVFVGFVYLIVITISDIAISPTFPVLIAPKCTAGNNHTLLIKAPVSTKQMISMSIQLIKFQGQLSQQVYCGIKEALCFPILYIADILEISVLVLNTIKHRLRSWAGSKKRQNTFISCKSLQVLK